MKALTVSELDKVLEALQALEGGRLQEIRLYDKEMGLGLWTQDGLIWIWIDMNPHSPLILPLLGGAPRRDKGLKKPLSLFISAHFSNLWFRGAHRDLARGRVVFLQFEDADGLLSEIEVRLFPHGQNILARAHGKQVCWQKPLPVEQKELGAMESQDRSFGQILSEYRNLRQEKPKSLRSPVSTALDQRARKKSKLLKAIEKVRAEIEDKQSTPWFELGEWLKAHQTLEVPEGWGRHLDVSKNLAGNIQRCFQKARETQRKLEGTEARLKELQRQVELLAQDDGALESPGGSRPSVPVFENVKTRTLDLGLSSPRETPLKAYLGRSGRDNLQLLRQARSWDFWVHLKDAPGAHVIVRREKGAKVSDDQWLKLGRWLLEESLSQKQRVRLVPGEKFELIICECRNVRPIRGDRLGRVNYQAPRIFSFRYS